MLISVALHRKERLVALGPHKAEPERDGSDIKRPKIHRHIHRHLIDRGLPHPVRGAVEIAASAKRRGEDDERALALYEYRRRSMRHHIIAPRADIDDAEEIEALFKERPGLCELTRDGRRVIDEEIELSMAFFDELSRRDRLFIPRMIDLDTRAIAASFADRYLGLFDGAAKRMRI